MIPSILTNRLVLYFHIFDDISNGVMKKNTHILTGCITLTILICSYLGSKQENKKIIG